MAHAMLTDPASSATAAAIAEDVGFVNGSSFGRVFRREYGYTPE
jgi:transcriptional regulator GlxA family with amidase domain